jgi:Arc/MetJ family transcription regulator
MGRTNIVLDNHLVEDAMRLSGTRTKREAVHLALYEYVDNHSKMNLLDLKGQNLIDDDYDYKAARENLA